MYALGTKSHVSPNWTGRDEMIIDPQLPQDLSFLHRSFSPSISSAAPSQVLALRGSLQKV